MYLHPSQLSAEVVLALRKQGLEIHAWSVNDEPSLEIVAEYGISRVCADDFKQALAFRDKASRSSL